MSAQKEWLGSVTGMYFLSKQGGWLKKLWIGWGKSILILLLVKFLGSGIKQVFDREYNNSITAPQNPVLAG